MLHNALAYAGAGSTVTLRTGCTAQQPWLEVEDDGPGIASGDRDAVFERFRRGRGAGGQGSGLGLSIVRDIARAHGGTVTLSAGASGRGLRVRLGLAASR